MFASSESGEPSDTKPDFENLFAHPSLAKMLDQLTWQQFEDFVRYVFECAGYTVEKVASHPQQHVDLLLYSGKSQSKPATYVEVRRYATASILKARTLQFIGAINVRQGHSGFLVTTSQFTRGAHQVANESRDPKITLVDGAMLLRYVTYVGGSRLGGQYAGESTAVTLPISPVILEEADIIYQKTARAQRLTRILAVVNPKGGVAKTTTSLNVAFALAEMQRQRVLLVDMDGQGSLTRALPSPAPRSAPKPLMPVRDGAYISDYFRGTHTLHDLVQPTRFPGLALIPSEEQLYRLQIAGGNRTRAELRFVEDLRALKSLPGESDSDRSSFNWIILDTPAGDTFYSRAALAAADYVLIPAYAETFAGNGIRELFVAARTMGALAGNIDSWRDRILGCVITRWKNGANARDNAVALKLQLGNEGITVFPDEVPQDDRVETAHRGTVYGGTRHLFHIGRQLGPAARAYDHLVEEILKHVHDREAQTDRR